MMNNEVSSRLSEEQLRHRDCNRWPRPPRPRQRLRHKGDSNRCCHGPRQLQLRQPQADDLFSTGRFQLPGARNGGDGPTAITAEDCAAALARGGGRWRALNHEAVDLESRFWMDGGQGDDGTPGANPSCSSSSSSTRGLREPKKLVPLPGESDCSADFSSLPFDVMIRIVGSFSWPNLWAASRVCKVWNAALEPLRQGMLFVHWGKKWKHGLGGVSRNLDKALDSFLKGASRGCTAAMVDAGLLLWEVGKMEEGMHWYKRAADLGDPAGQCSLGRAYLQEPCKPVEAVKLFHRAALAGHVRAQYNLALCLQHGRGIAQDMAKASLWYLRGAEGGNTRAMYNTALCFSGGQGLALDKREARRWMRRAALAGHRKAQHEHGFALYKEGDKTQALTYLELAIRAGETAGTPLRDSLLLQLPPKARAHSIAVADLWEARRMKHS